MTASVAALLLSVATVTTDPGNRLVYLDEFCDPYYVGLQMPKLITPQWIGEDGVEAVIVLANDDHKDPDHHEAYFRPILKRLHEIDGQAGVSLMTTRVDPTHPQLQVWLREEVSLEAHTTDHPCPCLQGGDLAKAKATFDSCVDLLKTIPNARPVAFRMPCCDSMNSVSPRFFAEVFNRKTEKGNFLSIDSSVFHIFSANDPALPRKIVFDKPDRERFRKYVPTDRLMVNLIEDYPFPYVIGQRCWEIPCLMPSDWDAQHLNGKCSPVTVADLKAAVDAVVVKRGIFSLCFHTHGWIRNDQVIEMIDYAVARHGKKVKFLNFREVQERLNGNLLGNQPLRTDKGLDNGVRLLDLNQDGYLDVVIGNEQLKQTRTWMPDDQRWRTDAFPNSIVYKSPGHDRTPNARFGVLQRNGFASVLWHNGDDCGLWHYGSSGWTEVPDGLAGLELDGSAIETVRNDHDGGVRMRDFDGDGFSELIVLNEAQNGIFTFLPDAQSWKRLPIQLPPRVQIVNRDGGDAGLRFVGLEKDRRLDILFSNADRFSLHQFGSIDRGWSRTLAVGKRGEKEADDEIPMIVRADGTNNGVWFSHDQMWIQNEDTGKSKPDHVDRRGLARFLTGALGKNTKR